MNLAELIEKLQALQPASAKDATVLINGVVAKTVDYTEGVVHINSYHR